jgi:hypothetical protein
LSGGEGGHLATFRVAGLAPKTIMGWSDLPPDCNEIDIDWGDGEIETIKRPPKD